MKGSLDKLQSAVAERIRSLADIAKASVCSECVDETFGEFGNGEGLEILVKIPMPVEASKYAAGPVFSKVKIEVLVERNANIAANAPSMAFTCECISKILHAWAPPENSGYGKLFIAGNPPWSRGAESAGGGKKFSMSLFFEAQSVLG